jgi:hypothetical protein
MPHSTLLAIPDLHSPADATKDYQRVIRGENGAKCVLLTATIHRPIRIS